MRNVTETTMTAMTPESPPPDEQPRRRFAIRAIAALAGLVVLAGVAFGTARLIGNVGADQAAGVPVEVTVASGSSAASIYALLDEKGVASAGALQTAAQALDVESKLQAGTYAFTTGMDPTAVIEQLVLGSNVESPVTFTVVEGWTVAIIIEELASATPHTQADFTAALGSGDLSSTFLPQNAPNDLARWEGLLFPATYPIDP